MSKQYCKRLIAADLFGMLAAAVTACCIMGCRKKECAADRSKRAFKEIEDRLEA